MQKQANRGKPAAWARAAAAVALAVMALALPAAPSVALDPSFGTSPPGVVRISDPSLIAGHAIAVMADGSTIVASTSGVGGYNDQTVVQRLSPSGVVDMTFGPASTPGRVELAAFQPTDVKIDGSQRIVVAANGSTSGVPRFGFRLSASGVIDLTFDGTFDVAGHRPSRLLQVDGAIVVATWNPANGDACLQRFRASDGARDATFGPLATPGRACLTGLTDVSNAFGYRRTDGGYVLVASTYSSTRVVRFDGQGVSQQDRSIGQTPTTLVYDATATSDGRLMLLALTSFASGPSVTIRRYDGSLQLDASFNAGGKSPGEIELGSFAPASLLVLADDRLVVTGAQNDRATAQLFTADGRGDGALESSSPQPGSTTFPPGTYPGWTPNTSTFAGAITSGGRLVLVGTESKKSGFDVLGSAAVVVRTDVIGAAQPRVPGLLRPLAPTRILDTRPGVEQVGYAGPKPLAGDTVTLQIAGRAGIPTSGIGAVLMNLTATEATAAGYVTVWPTGAPRPTASNLNLERVGETLPNLVVAPVGADGTVSIFTQSGTHLIADAVGWFPVGGGLQTVVPQRVLETRTDPEQIAYAGAKPSADQTLTLPIAGRAGLPNTGVEVAILNVTITDAGGPGYVSVWPSGISRPLISNLNVDRVGQTAQNLVVVPVGADGAIQLYTNRGGHLLADLVGWLPTGSGYTPSPTSNARTDTRFQFSTPDVNLPPLPAGSTLRVSGEAIVVANVTATEAVAPGFVTVWPSGTARPTSSNLNLEFARQTIANLVVTATGGDGGFDIYTQSGTHLVVDVFGTFPLPPS